MKCMLNCMHMFGLFVKFWVSGKFPEIAWWVTHGCQAAHLITVYSGFPEKNRLAVNSRPLGDAWCFI